MLKLSICFAILSLSVALKTINPCRSQKTDYGYVCTCDEYYCDSLHVPLPRDDQSHVLITSSNDGDRFTYKAGQFSNIDCKRNECVQCNLDTVTVIVERRISSREIIGFGGAFTGAVTHVLSQFSPQLRKHFYKSYYSRRSGIGYTMMRMPIGGSDFDIEKWVYNLNPENDSELSNFNVIDPRDKLRNAQIKELKRATRNNDLKIIAAAWMAAPWLRANKQWNGFPNNQILPEYYQTWADYHAKWLNLMKADGIPIWGLSPGNEPAFMQMIPFPTLSWNATEQGKWLVEYLIPTLKWSGNGHLKILGVDDMRNVTMDWLRKMDEGNSRATDNIDIVAMHPYFDGLTSPKILDSVHRAYDKPILYTEMSFAVMDTPEILPGSWTRAEGLIKILMDALNHDVAGYIDWNLMLNSTGGPRYDENRGLDAFILANDDFTGFIKQPLFYAMAHFAKYIPPGSKRIQTNLCGAQHVFIQSLAYLRPDHKVTLILYNNHTDNFIDVNIVDETKGKTTVQLKPKSLNTLVYLLN